MDLADFDRRAEERREVSGRRWRRHERMENLFALVLLVAIMVGIAVAIILLSQ